ncbi:hypothetical protein ACFQWB_01575 [Paenibacillus thermoaerophilus]|uniref:DUF4190 domain-containing protein n=1 Tax=Paenibacillus thermoaerophilus TaxID=1215385 RepID=A0ABW2UZH1_9BACL|nr:hypothetical protein [Paenibacillus thermoaerophilus]TMV19047.1 hypothetical protein FE781_00600 [Paenibacillus thermoaerophilus]
MSRHKKGRHSNHRKSVAIADKQRKQDAESAAELAPAPDRTIRNERPEEGNREMLKAEQDASRAYLSGMLDQWVGWIALALGLLSLLVAPITLGSLAVAVGLLAFWMGRRAMGGWAIALGLLSIVSAVWLMPVLTQG